MTREHSTVTHLRAEPPGEPYRGRTRCTCEASPAASSARACPAACAKKKKKGLDACEFYSESVQGTNALARHSMRTQEHFDLKKKKRTHPTTRTQGRFLWGEGGGGARNNTVLYWHFGLGGLYLSRERNNRRNSRFFAVLASFCSVHSLQEYAGGQASARARGEGVLFDSRAIRRSPSNN